jgi:hypothetical protein
MSDLGQLNSMTADNLAVIVVTDTLGDGLNQDFFENLRSLYPRARLLCLFDRISRQTEKAMRSVGLLFLGSYEHFDDCYGSVLERVSEPQKANQHQPYQTSDKPLKAQGTAKGVKEKGPDRWFSSHLNARFENRMEGSK